MKHVKKHRILKVSKVKKFRFRMWFLATDILDQKLFANIANISNTNIKVDLHYLYTLSKRREFQVENSIHVFPVQKLRMKPTYMVLMLSCFMNMKLYVFFQSKQNCHSTI